MTASPQEQSARLRQMTIAIVSLSLLIYAGTRVLSHYQHKGSRPRPTDTTWKDTRPTSWEGVPAMLDVAIHSNRYQYGGNLLSNPSVINKASDMQIDAYSYRLAIDFLRSLSPEQIAFFQRKQPLPFTQLTPQQQEAMLRLGESRVQDFRSIVDNAVTEKSTLVVDKYPDTQIFMFDWMAPAGRDSSTLFRLTFSAEAQQFLHPYRRSANGE